MNTVIRHKDRPNQVTSKQRVIDHGEVFTAEREVNAMLDLVKHETERIESRFLEPACGTGNFLIEILKRKLTVVEQRYSKNQLEYERYAILAISSIYGIDILEDNAAKCRKRLFKIFDEKYTSSITKNIDWIDENKIFISKAYGERGSFPYRVISKPFLGEKNTCCAETYLVIGPFSSKRKAQNVISYIETRFFRFLVLLIKNTQNAMKKVYSFVPM